MGNKGSFKKGHSPTPTSFKKGHLPWNKVGRPILNCKICNKEFLGYLHRQSKYCSLQCCGVEKRGKPTWMKGKRRLFAEDKSATWKGDFASFSAMHKWVVSKKGRAKSCEHCGKEGKYSGKKELHWNIHWANKNHSYKRVLSDYIGLCVSCHRKFDIKYNNYPISVHNRYHLKT